MARITLSENDYFKKIEKKSASLFKAACQCGAIAANGSPSENNALRLFGENYGVAYQIRDDILDVEASKNDVQPDVGKFRSTLPIIQLFESEDKENRKLLEGLFASKTKVSPRSFLNALTLNLEKSGSLIYCASKVDLYVDKAIDSLCSLKESIFKEYLIEMAEGLRIKQPKCGSQKIYL